MDNKDRRKKILRISGLIGLFLLVFGLSYALFTVTLNGTKKVKVKTGKLELQLLDENNNDITDANNAGYVINLDNQVPVDDETGLGTQAFEFKLKNNGTIDASYTIYLDDVALEEGEDRLPDSAVRYSLTKNGSSDSAQDLTTIGTNPNRKLDEGIIKKDVTNTYTLKIWIDEEVTNEAMDKVFAATLRVVGEQYVEQPSPYGTKIAEEQITDTITVTYYQPEETSGYNSNNSIKRISNVKNIDNEATYEGGTLVVSGTGEIPDSAEDWGNWSKLTIFLVGAESSQDMVDNYEKYFYYDGADNLIYFYKPQKIIVEEGITSIGNAAFDHMNSVTSVELPSTLLEIKFAAFRATSLSNVDLPESMITLENDAFSETLITSLKMPASITTLSPVGLSLTELLVEGDNLQYDGSGGSSGASIGNATIYCKTQACYDNLQSQQPLNAASGNVNIVVDPSKFE